ncbi:Uncharacterized protein SCF082_LOCUS16580 [Durusdinium trenchii]|uniref:CCHC-type domain-containing protein n=1 Tax=Durusdinium trenchii TaxID=1381693 RepID=A0ABP0KC91_9DINO
MLGKSAPTNAAVPTSAQTPEQLIASALNQALAGERKTLPSWNGSPSTLRSWLKLIALWEYESNVPVEKRGIKLLQSFPEGSQPRRIADTIPTEVLLSANGYGAILGALHQKYAPFLEATAPQAIDKFLFDGERQKGESFTSYIAAKTLAKQEMELQLGEVINDRLCGRILLKHANLNDLQREMLLLRGPMLRPFDEIANLLRPLDRPEMLARAQEPSSSRNYMITSDYYQDYYPDNPENEEDNETEGDPMDLESWPHEDGDESASCDENGNCLFYMEDREYQETEAIELKAYHLAYRDARRELQKRKTERGYVKHGRDPGRSKGGKKGVRRPFVKGRGKGKSKRKQSSSRSWKGNEEDLESRTRCWNCNELGHFAKNCPLSQRADASSSPPRQQFVVHTGGQTAPGVPAMQFMMAMGSSSSSPPRRLTIFAGVQCYADEALVDTAAEEAVIGTTALQELEKSLRQRNLKCIPVQGNSPLPSAGGVGGEAKVVKQLEVPVGVAQVNAVLRFTVLQDDDQFQTPPLLPVSFLEHIEATIDLKNNLLTTGQGQTASMRRLGTAHRAVSLTNFSPRGWNLPVSHRRDPDVDPFVLQPERPLHFHVAQYDPNTVTVWLLHQDQLHFLQSFPGSRYDMIFPQDCVGLQDTTSLEPERVTYARLEDGHRMVIRDQWNTHDKRYRSLQQPWTGELDMSALRNRAAQILKEPEPQPEKKKTPQDRTMMAETRWKRLVLAIFVLFKSMRTELTMEYLTRRQDIYELETEEDRKKHVKTKSADPAQWTLRMQIGKPLSRSVAQKTWAKDPDDCKHPEDQLRHRAGRGHFWYTCLGCGSRWERLSQPAEATSSSSSTQIVQPIEKKNNPQGYPKKLPAPRYRADLGDFHINVQLKEKETVPQLTQGPIPPTVTRRGMEEMEGLVPVRRAKSPTARTGTPQPEMFMMMSKEEWEDAMMDYQEVVEEELQMVHGEHYTEHDREEFLDR